MKIYTADFAGVWLTGYAVIFANDKAHAHRQLAAALTDRKLADKQTTLPELTLQADALKGEPARCIILFDGNY